MQGPFLRPLNTLKANESGTVMKMTTSKDVSLKLIEMGVNKGEHVKLIRRAPFGDPIEIEVMNYRLAIRNEEARQIFLK